MNNLPEHIAPELIAAFLSHQIDSEDHSIVQQWIEATVENRKTFEQYKTVWELTGQIPAPVTVDVDLAWNKLNRRIANAQNKTAPTIDNHTKVIKMPTILYKVAAVLFPLLAVASYLIYRNFSTEILMYQTAELTLHDTLSDGSVVSINKHSKLYYPETFEGATRELKMEGEIYFDVKPNKSKPFIIHAENTIIRVVGTSFNVRSLAGGTTIEVSVASGCVVFAVPDDKSNDTVSISLVLGEKGIYNKTNHKLTKLSGLIADDVFWNSKLLIFSRTELANTIQTLQKCYNRTIILKNEQLKKMHFTATFKNQSLDSILQVVTGTFDLKLVKKDDTYILE